MKPFTLLLLAIVFSACAASHQGAILSENQVKHHPEVVVAHLGGDVNTSSDDFALVPGPAGLYSYLTSDRSGGAGRQDLYVARVPLSAIQANQSGNFNSIREINTSENEGCATFTPDGNTMIFAAAGRSDGLGSSDLYQADLINGTWQNTRNLTALNTSSWESQPSLSSDGKTLYFVSNRPGGYGGQDIYVSTRVGDNWTTPQNLGPIVNSAGMEASPFIAADNNTLYFSSNGHPGLGGYDVYVTHNTGGVWSQPEDAGVPINSAADDLFYSAELGTQHAFLASNRSGTLGDLDIFSVEPNPFPPGGVTIVRGFVRDAMTRQPLSADITITNLQSGEEVARFRSADSTGLYLVVLQPGQTYSITAQAEGYLFYSDVYPVTSDTNVSLRHDIDLNPTLSGKTRLLVFFDFNSSVLKKESFPDLNRAVTLLKNNPNMSVTVAGYTDSIGSAEFNLKLSDARARSVLDYLITHGIPASRVQAIGYGESNPIATNETDEGRAMNRRVEFQVRTK
ncbi:MAG TPA: OmpA family protein [Candidatus Kapabacteria bacterium]|jgi:outer membrane protein OmpA-like peptidoglycan-associated protein|nr:OmpA family protein [Candidatus Kapabacteria bacterium]